MIGAGRFITFEGIEGAGKSLQLQAAADLIRSRGLEVVVTREPGGTGFGRELRSILLASQGPPRVPAAELLLYLADRVQHLQEVVEPALARGAWVVSDRYHHATLAYQGHARDLGVEWIQGLARQLEIRVPDLVLVLDLPVETGLARARSRNRSENSSHGRFEEESLEFHRRVRNGYLSLAAADPGHIEVVNAEGTPAEVAARVREVLVRRILP